MHRPKETQQMTTAVKLQKKKTNKIAGTKEVNYIDSTIEPIFLCNFKTFGGTESVINGVITIISTAQITCFYRPDIQAGDRLVLLGDDGITALSFWEILGDPEDIEFRHQFLQFKVKSIKGGA